MDFGNVIEIHCAYCHNYSSYYYGEECQGHCVTKHGRGALTVNQEPPDPNAPITVQDEYGRCGVCGSSHPGTAHGELWWQESSRDHVVQSVEATDKALTALRATLAAEAPKS